MAFTIPELTIPAIKDAAILDIMNALNKGQPSVNSASTFEPLNPMGAARSGFFNMPKQYPVAPAFNTTPLEEAFTGFTNANTLSPFSIIDQQDAQDMQTQQSEQEKLLRLYDTALSTTNQKNINAQAQLEGFGNSMDAISKQDAIDSQLAQSSYDQLGKLFSVNTPSSSPDYWKTAATIRLNQSKLDEYNTPPTKYGPDFIRTVFEANKDKNFVQRALNPTKSLDLGNGDFATHRMSYSTFNNGKARMYPEVVEKDGKLVQLDPKAAYDYAIANNEFIDLPEKDAEWLSQNYKSIWTPENYRIMQAKVTQPPIVSKVESDYTNITDPSKVTQPPIVSKVESDYTNITDPSKVTVTTPPAPVTAASTKNAVTPMMEDTVFNSLHARIDLLRDSSSDILTTQQLLHLEDMIPMDPKGAEAIITSLESQAKAMGNNRGPFGGGYNQYLETLSRVEQGEREVVEKYKKLFEDRGVILKDKPTPNWFMLAAGLMIGGKGGAAFLNGYTQSYQARYQNERNSKIQIIEDQMKALEMDAKMLGSEENFSKARLSVAADTAKILGQMKDTIMARYTVEKAPELQNLLNWEVQNTLDKNGEYTQLTFPKLQEYMLATKLAKTPKEAEVAARIYVAYKQDSIQKLSSQMLHNIWSTNLQTAAIEQRKSGKITNQDTLVPSEYINFSIPQSTKESQIPTTMLTRFQSAGTLPVLSKVAQLISTGVIPLSVTSTPYELTAGLPSEIKNDEVYKKYYGGNPNLLLKDVNTMFTAFNSSINIPKLQEEVTTNTGKMTSAYNNIMNYALKDLGTLPPESKSVIKTMVGKVVFSTPELINNPAVIKTFAQYLSRLKEEDIRKIATPTNIYDNIDYSSAILQVPDYFINFSKELTTEGSKWSLVNANNNKNLSDSKNDTTIIKKSLNTIQSFKSGLDTILATTPTSILNMPMMGENVNIDDYTSFYTAAAKSALYGALAQSIPQEHPELRMYLGDSDAQTSSVVAKTKIDMRDEFTLYDTYTNKTGTSFTDTINEYLTSMRISAIDLNNNYGMLAYSTSTTVPNQEAWYASKLQSPKIVALQSRIDELTNTLSASSDPINDVTTRANLRKLDQALKQYRELLLK